MSLKLITLAALGTAAQAATTYSKAKCITGYASNLQKDQGIPLVIIDSPLVTAWLAMLQEETSRQRACCLNATVRFFFIFQNVV